MNPLDWAMVTLPSWPRRVLCLVTDRTRIALTTTSATSWRTLLLAQIEGAIAGGVDVVQIRERDLDAAALTWLVRECLRLVAGRRTRIVVNDRLDVALASRAHGVHLREDGVSAEDARSLAGANLTIGRSIHSAAAARRSGPVDYLIAGPVFGTASKPDADSALGLAGLWRVVRATDRPIWAIGGITASRIPAVVAAGAQGVAAIGAFIPPDLTGDLSARVQELTENLRFSFDSSAGVS